MSRHRIAFALFVAALLLACPACGTGDRHDVTIVTDGETFTRTLEISSMGFDDEFREVRAAPRALDEAALARLRRVYGGDVTVGDVPLRLSRTFERVGPDDLGGRSVLSVVESPLGSLHAYRERFGGTDDAATIDAKRRDAIGRLTRLIRTWLTRELGSHPKFSRVKRFLDERLENDLDNLSLLVAGPYADVVDEHSMGTRFARAGLYLFEHGYFESPVLLDGQDFHAALRRNLRRMLRASFDVAEDDGDPPQLAFVATDEALLQSLDRFMRTTRAWRRLIREARAAGEDVESGSGAATGAIADVLLKSCGVDMRDWGKPVHPVHLTLHCPVVPLRTNGTWEDGVVAWKGSAPADNRVAGFFHADWVVPDTVAQTKAFGRVVAEGSVLERIVAVHASLGLRQRARWRGIQDALVPDSAAAQLDRLRSTLVEEPEADQLLALVEAVHTALAGS